MATLTRWTNSKEKEDIKKIIDLLPIEKVVDLMSYDVRSMAKEDIGYTEDTYIASHYLEKAKRLING